MYDPHLHQTNQLLDDLHTEMNTYNFEKERLVHQLSTLHSKNHSSITQSQFQSNLYSQNRRLLTRPQVSSMEVSTSSNISARNSNFYRAPNIVAGNAQTMAVNEEYVHLAEKKKDRKEHVDRMKKESNMLKLPVIHSARSKRSEWDSSKSFQETMFSHITNTDSLPKIAAAKSLLEESMKIPSIHDPQRTDKAFDTFKKRKSLKRVTFADENHGKLSEMNQTETKSKELNTYKGNGKAQNPTSVPFPYAPRPVKYQRHSTLPPLSISDDEKDRLQKITEGVNEWKSLYSKMTNPEEKTRALSDILNAVRMKKFENELAMKYGDTLSLQDKDKLVKDFNTRGISDKILYRDHLGHAKSGCLPANRSTSLARLQMGLPNTHLQLQNYLHNLSRARHILDSMGAKGTYSRAKRFKDSNASQIALEQKPTTVSVQG